MSSVFKALAVFLLLSVCTLVATTTATADSDPLGDTSNQGTGVQLDIVLIDAVPSATDLVISVEFAQPVLPPSADAPNSVFATIYIDSDENPSTGFAGGAEFQVETGSELIHPGKALVANERSPEIGTAPTSFSSNRFEVRVPLSLINDDGAVNYLVIVHATDPSTGNRPETDRAPNSGVATSVSAAPVTIGKTGGPAGSASGQAALAVAVGAALMVIGAGLAVAASRARTAAVGIRG